jgi:hypothetical protein
MTSKKGSGCSREGRSYELQIHKIVSKCVLNGKTFNTQKEEDLAGCSAENDIECNFNGERDVPIEIKKAKTPDWMQLSLKFDSEMNRWIGSSKNKIPHASKEMFEEMMASITLFGGNIPPFMTKDITHEEWLEIKKTGVFKDTYIDCPKDMIQRLYGAKGCYYIQVSGQGLYHLGTDICGFQVPEFVCDQQLRVRTKIHTTCVKSGKRKGFCSLSVTVACQPKQITSISKSPYSLDEITRLPLSLVYNS